MRVYRTINPMTAAIPASFALAIQEETNPLHGIKLFEIVDAAKAERYLKSPHMTDKYDKGREIKGYSSPSQQLRNYIKNYMATYNAIPVVYNRPKSKFGRVHPKDSLALCSIPRVIRNTLIHKTYYDFDLVNAQPAILRAVLNANNYKVAEQFKSLEKYVTERETIIQQVMQYHSVSRKSAKDYFIHVAFGKSYQTWHQSQEIVFVPNCIEQYEHEKLMENYEKEIQAITKIIIDANEPLYKKYCDAYRHKPENEKKFNELGSFMSMYLQEMETRVVGRVMDWVINNTSCTAFKNARGSTYHVASYQFDGIQLLQESVNEFDGGLDGFIAALNQQTAALTDLHGIQWICKPMTDDMNKAFEEEEAKREADAEIDQHMQKTSILRSIESRPSYDETFAAMKKQFELEHFKVIQNSCFVQETSDELGNRKLIQRNTTELLVAFGHLKLNFVAFEGVKSIPTEKSIPFIPKWLESEDIRRYDRMDCFPDASKCPPNCFNIWTPFEMERYNAVPFAAIDDVLAIPLVAARVRFLRNHISIMCDHQPDTLAEFEKWIAQMIQFPDTKSHMPIFQSQEGSGKGSFVQLIRKILGHSKVKLTASPEEHVWGRFNNMMETSFLIFFDEISKQMTNGGIDKLKNIITEPTIEIQHKGKGSYECTSFHRFAGLTNAWDGGMTITKGARRFLMCKMSDEKKGVVEYWNTFYECIEDINTLRGFYHHYKIMPVPRVLPAPIKTEFAQDLQELSTDVPTQWLTDMLRDAKCNKDLYLQNKTEFTQRFKMVDGEYVVELSGKQAFLSLIEWCKENGFDKYETNPIKLGVYLKSKKLKGIVKGPHTNMGERKYYKVEQLLQELSE